LGPVQAARRWLRGGGRLPTGAAEAEGKHGGGSAEEARPRRKMERKPMWVVTKRMGKKSERMRLRSGKRCLFSHRLKN
jgi:hypothetical protein